jgi:hypothetical protein
MRVLHVRFKIAGLMIVIAAAALALTLFAGRDPGSRELRLFTGFGVLTILLIWSSPFLIDRDMSLMTFLVLVAAATVSSWLFDAWRAEWYVGAALFVALIVPLPLSWWTVKCVNTRLRDRSRTGYDARIERPYPSPTMILFLTFWCSIAMVGFFGIVILINGIGP